MDENKQPQETVKPETSIQSESLKTQTPTTLSLKKKSPIITLLLVIVLFAISVTVYIGYQNYVLTNQKIIPSPTPSPISSHKLIIPPSPTPSPNCNLNAKSIISKDGKWNIFESFTCEYSFSYPINWNIDYYTNENCLVVGDLKNPAGVDPESIKNHSTVQICLFPGKVESAFPYDNGLDASENKTIAPFSLNGFSGVRGKQNSMFGIQDVVNLQGPHENWASIISTSSDKIAISQILSTFKFVEQTTATPTNTLSLENNHTSWKTYNDASLKFKIDYPANWLFATNTINKEFDKYGVLEPEHVVIFTEKEIDTISTYQFGRMIISKRQIDSKMDIENWFNTTFPVPKPGEPVTGTEPSIVRTFTTQGKIKVVDTGAYFINQKYYFILNNYVFSVDVNYANDDTGLASSKNTLLQKIYEKMIYSISSI